MEFEQTINESYMSKLDIRTKITGFIVVMVLSFLYMDPLYNFGIAIFITLLAISIKLPYEKAVSILKPLILIFIFIMIITAFTYSPSRFHTESAKKVLFYVLPNKRMGATAGGFYLGITYLLRIYIMVFLSIILCETTPMDDFLQLLSKMRVPYEICIIINIALRFIPVMDKKRVYILEAQKARGAKLNDKGAIGQIKSFLPIMVPLIINSILISNTLSISMSNRGYGYRKSWTSMRDISYKPIDYVATVMITVIGAVGIYLRYKYKFGIL